MLENCAVSVKSIEEFNGTMKISVVCVFVGVLAAFVCDSSAQIGGPGLGWAIGQQASVNAVSLAIDGALAKADPATLPPELQVSDTNGE